MSERKEYRVVWQREGLPKARKLYQTRKGAEGFASVLQGMHPGDHERDPDALFCCSGHMCPCEGRTWAQHWEHETAQYPALTHGPVIEARDVGEWEAP